MKYSLLIVDNNENVLKDLRTTLINGNYIIHSVSNAEEALIMIASHKIDIVISEIDLPGMSGFELLNRIKILGYSVNFIFYTLTTNIQVALKAFREGASDFVEKNDQDYDIVCSLNRLNTSSKSISTKNEKAEDTSSNKYLISKSPAMINVLNLARQVADTRATIMLYGDTGTGKGVMANLIHNLSSRRDKPFVKVNCAAIPEQLLESELFGYEKGAFTGAVTNKPGRFEVANGGTIFLDEIGDITSLMQVKLLRVLQEKEFEHLGGNKTYKVDVRVIAATNKNLENMVSKGTFREDLFYRLNVVPITLPPLKDRKEDIQALIEHFLKITSNSLDITTKTISPSAIDKLINFNWPGNIRQLENVIERCVVITPKNIIDVDTLPDAIRLYSPASITSKPNSKLEEYKDNIEKEEIIAALIKCDNNKTKAAELLGISRRSLHRKILKYNIDA